MKHSRPARNYTGVHPAASNSKHRLNRTFTIPSRFHPARSPLGRWVRRRSPDRRTAESTYLVAAVTLAAALLVAQVIAWTSLQPMSDPALYRFVAAQLAVAAAYAALALSGRQPAVDVEVTGNGLRVDEEPEGGLDRRGETFIPFSEIRGVSVISARTYYGHYARYAETLAYVNRIHPTLLLLECPRRPVILGLEPSDLLELERLLVDRAETAPPSSRAGAA